MSVSMKLRLSAALVSAAALIAAGGVMGAAPKVVDYNVVTGTKGLIMIDKVGGFIRFFDPKTYEEIPGVAFDPSPTPGIKPHEMAISHDHKFAYVTVYGDGVYGNNPHPGRTLAIVDLDAKKMAGSIELTPDIPPHAVQIAADGKLWVTAEDTRKVLVIDPKTRKIEGSVDVEGTGHWIALAPGHDKLYVASKDDRRFISVVDTKQRKMIGKVPMPNGSQGIVAAPDGSKVLVADYKDSTLAVISPRSDTVVDHIPVPGAGGVYKVFYSPNGQYVLTLKINGQMTILDANNLKAPQKVLQVGRAAMGFAFAPDGKTAIVGNHSDGTASVIDLAAGSITRTFPAGKGVETLQFF